jgi:hypothetical protein
MMTLNFMDCGESLRVHCPSESAIWTVGSVSGDTLARYADARRAWRQ